MGQGTNGCAFTILRRVCLSLHDFDFFLKQLNLRDDSFLLGNGWERNSNITNLSWANMRYTYACCLSFNSIFEQTGSKNKSYIFFDNCTSFPDS